MTEGQKNRLLGTLVGIEQIRAQIAGAARDGRSPAQSGRALTPLPPDGWEEIERALEHLSDRARALSERFAEEGLREREAREPVGATLYWIAFLLRRLDEEVLDDLSPGRMAQFGKLPEEARTALEEAVAQMRADLAVAQRQVTVLRQGAAKSGQGPA